MVEQTSTSSILELQQALNQLKIKDNSGKKLEENGVEDSPETETAIQTLQLIMGLHTDGSPGVVTQSAINWLHEKLNWILNEQQPEDHPILRPNHAGGPLVSYVQYLVAIVIDGVYGPETASKIEGFQMVNGLTVDGIVGAQTWKKLLGTESLNLYVDNLSVGSSGSDVEKLQQKLKELDLYHKEIDGLFGQGVEQAVKEFQESQGFASDGVAGPSTLIALDLMTVEPESVEQTQIGNEISY